MQLSSKIEEALQGEDLIPLGPKALSKKSEWARIMRDFRIYDSSSKEVALALIGLFKDQVFFIVDHIMISNQSSQNNCSYSVLDLKSIDKDASKHGFILGGIAHNHPSGSIVPSESDKKSWISTVIDFDHPIYFFIVTPSNNKVSCSAIPFETWATIKDAIKPVEVAIKD